MDNQRKHALINEGGAMRGIFAAGVLDSFMDNQFKPFDFCMGVSAGSTNLASYLTNQRGRSHKIITDYSCRSPFINFRKYLFHGHYIDLDWLWKIAYKEYRLDSFAYAHQPTPLWVVTTNVDTGEAEYHQPTEENLEDILLASCAVPLAYRGYPLAAAAPQTDGGVADSIPVIEAYQRGAREITVVLSQLRGYRKRAPKFPNLIRRLFRRKPHLAEALLKRHEAYNAAIDFIENPPEDCVIHTISPLSGFNVGRTTTDSKKLTFGYEMGLMAGQEYVTKVLGENVQFDASLKRSSTLKEEMSYGL
jgi:predicted patatin/cPLA2 family phospholipase